MSKPVGSEMRPFYTFNILPKDGKMTLRTFERQSDLNIGISERNREGVVKILNILLADEYIFYTRKRGIITGM